MREILFRGKRLDNGEWMYGDLQIGDDDHIPMIGTVGPGRWVEYIQVDENTIGQYTGLRDKNGEKVWEGDIFRNDCGIIWTVFAVPGGFACESNPLAFGFYTPLGYHPYNALSDKQNASWFRDNCVVIGNVHDNSELLKQII